MVTHRHAAIVIADVAGYSRLMAEDETATHNCLMAILHDLVPDMLKHHGGRMVKTMGDGLMAEFDDSLQALDCAMAFQDAVCRLPPAETVGGLMRFRIGVNAGDVIDDNNEIFGTPVNVATRLESLAEPGGIVLSSSVFWQIKDRTELLFEELGFLQLKNIPHPVEVYRLVADGETPAAPARPGIRVWSEGDRNLPSVIVMPFDNLSQEPDQDYFCDGMVHDVTTDLSRFANLAVVSSNSAFAYKERRVDAAELQKLLGVEYAVWGAVQRSGQKIRLNVEIEETGTRRKLWAERFNGDMKDLFEMQDELVRRLTASLASKLNLVERERAERKDAGNLSSYEAFLKGLHAFNKFLETEENRETLEQSRTWFERSIELDETFGRPWGWLAYQKVQSWLHGWSGEDTLKEALKMARHATRLDPEDHDTHWALGSILFNAGEFEESRIVYGKALAINPVDADLHAEMAEMLSHSGEHMEALSRIRFAMHLNPHFPEWYRWALGWCYYFMKGYDEAIAELERMTNPSDEAMLLLAASHARLAEKHASAGSQAYARQEEKAANSHIKRFLRKRPDWTIERQKAHLCLSRSEDLDHLATGLRLAGLPEV